MSFNGIQSIAIRDSNTSKSVVYLTTAATTSSSTSTAITVVAASLVALLGYSAFKAYQQERDRDDKTPALRELPMPHRGYFPYIGHLLSLGPVPGQQLTEWSGSCGPIFQIKLGAKTWVVISDPKIAHEIFVTNGGSTSGRPANTYAFRVYSMGGKGVVFPSNGRHWRNTRKAVQTILAPSIVNDCQDLVEEEADALLARLLNSQQEGIHPYENIELMTLNVILNTVFGTRAASTDDPLYKEIHHYIDETITYSSPQNDIASYLPILAFIEKFGIEEQKKARGARLNKVRCALFERLIQQARALDNKCFIKRLDRLSQEFGLDDKDILVTSNDLMVAGTDTTAVTMSWTLAILVNHPNVQKTIQAEIDAFMAAHHGRLPKFSERQALPFLISVQKECMRYRPNSHFGVPHMAERDVDFHGYMIPKDAIIIANLHAIHTNPEIYPNADKFVPDRFLDSTHTMFAAANGKFEKRDTFNFGWGRRVCPGSYLAESEMFAALVRIFANFTLEPSLDENQQPVFPDLNRYVVTGVVVQPAQHKIRFVPRRHH